MTTALRPAGTRSSPLADQLERDLDFYQTRSEVHYLQTWAAKYALALKHPKRVLAYITLGELDEFLGRHPEWHLILNGSLPKPEQGEAGLRAFRQIVRQHWSEVRLAYRQQGGPLADPD